MDTAQSLNCSEDVVMAVQSSLTIGTDVEYLAELEVICNGHLESSCHENQQTAWDGSWLHVRSVEGVHNFLEAEGLDFVVDLFSSDVNISIVGHCAGIGVELDEFLSVGHESAVVLLEEFLGECEGIHYI